MKINKLLVMFLIIAMTIPIISYAINLPTEEQERVFFFCDKKEVVKGEVVTLTLNLDLIDYDNFEFILTSNTNLENISTEQENVDITTENNTFKFITSKTELNINQIALYYKLPEEIEVGTKIELTAVVKEYISDDEQSNETEEQKQQVTISITVIENDEDNDNQGNNINNSDNEQSTGNKVNIEQIKIEQQQNNKSKTINTQIQIQSQSVAGNLSVGETNTYNGESNNYLSTLQITNLNLIPQFSKTNTTYFVEVANDVTEIEVIAEAEDENATVNIYGNENLQVGENKILISVTAENGDVKTYRIYVTKNG